MHDRDFRRGRKRKEIKNVSQEIMAENFANLQKEADIQVQEAQRIPNKINTHKKNLCSDIS